MPSPTASSLSCLVVWLLSSSVGQVLLWYRLDGVTSFATPMIIGTATSRHRAEMARHVIGSRSTMKSKSINTLLHMSDPSTTSSNSSSGSSITGKDPMEEELTSAMMNAETLKQLEKQRRAQELRDQEVFMQKSTGKYLCGNCDWEYDETKGDAMMIGGQIPPGTVFADLPSNWRCPVCRASKDSFREVVEEIPGFAVNQGYGFGTNAWTAGQKNLAIFGGLGLFFLLFISGYAMS